MKKTILLLICTCLFTTLISGCGKKEQPPAPSPAAAAEAAEPPAAQDVPETQESAEPAASEAAEPGTLLESGTGLNENYYKGISCFGASSDLTDSTFLLGKVGMAFDGNAQPILEALTIHYDENTLVRTAILKNDSYELYSASLSDLEKYIENKNYSFDVFLEDSDADNLYAREIRISQLIF